MFVHIALLNYYNFSTLWYWQNWASQSQLLPCFAFISLLLVFLTLLLVFLT